MHLTPRGLDMIQLLDRTNAMPRVSARLITYKLGAGTLALPLRSRLA